MDQRLDLEQDFDTKDITFLPFPPSFISATTCYLYNNEFYEERLRKQQHSIFYLFLFIDDHVHHNNFLYTVVMFHSLYINKFAKTVSLFLTF